MIEIAPNVFIDENEVELEFIRSSGPGGQNVNKVASAVQLRYDVDASQTLPEPVKERLRQIAHNRITQEGILVIEAKRYRSQDKNREDAMARLIKLVYRATEKPKVRKKTRRTKAAEERRLENKRHNSEKKRMRKIKPKDLV